MTPADYLRLYAGIKTTVQGVKALSDLFDSKEPTPRATLRKVRNIDERVAPILDYVRKGKRDPKVRGLVEKTLSRKCNGGKEFCIKERDWQGEMKALFAVVRQNVRFLKDPRGLDLFKSTRRTLKWQAGDCAQSTTVMATLLETAGYHAKLRLVAVKPDGAEEFSHIMTIVEHPEKEGQWIAADASLDQPLGYYPSDEISGFRDLVIE